MKWLVRGGVALAALAVLGVAVLAWALPRLARSDAARARIEAASRAVLGRELRYADLEFGLLPPSLHVMAPELSGETADAPPLARAERVALRVQLLPLLRRQLEVQTLAVEGLALHLVREADGWVLPRLDRAPDAAPPGASATLPGAPPTDSAAFPGAPPTDSAAFPGAPPADSAAFPGAPPADSAAFPGAPPAAPTTPPGASGAPPDTPAAPRDATGTPPPPTPSRQEPGATPAAPETRGIVLGIRRISLSGASLVLEDRAVSPAVTWRIEDASLTARGRRLDQPVALEGGFGLAGGGEVEIGGSATRDGQLDVVLTLDGLALEPAVPYLGETRLAGRLDGTLQLTGDASDPRVRADLRVADAVLDRDALHLRGPLAVEADLVRAVSAPTGPFAVDADGAELAYASDFTKPAGTRGRLSGRLRRDASGAPAADDLVVELRNLVARGAAGPGGALTLDAEPFELEGWEALVPALGVAPLRGRLGVTGLRWTPDPAGRRGRLGLDALEATLPDLAPLALTGELVLEGATLRGSELTLLAAEQPFQVTAGVEQLYTAPRFELAFETQGADSDALLAGFAGQPDRLHGPLDAKGTLRGALGGGFTESLAGRLDFGIEGGRIVGSSLLEATLGSLGARLAEAGRQRDAKRWERFTREEFDALRGVLRIADGLVHTEPVTLEYPDYGARLEGPIRLDDLALDLRGTLTFHETLDAEIARSFGAPEAYVPERRTVDLASVRGKLGAPEVQLAGSSLAHLAGAYAAHVQRDELKRRVEEHLGEGSGEIVDRGLDVLEGLLRGRRER